MKYGFIRSVLEVSAIKDFIDSNTNDLHTKIGIFSSNNIIYTKCIDLCINIDSLKP